ncbi:unnamed protein product [Musa acuminata subsp. burmannicoides]
MVAGRGGGGWFRKLNGGGCRWPWKLRFATSWRWKCPSFLLRFSFLDDLLFRILYCLEAVVLVAALCFFYLCCGCHI